MIKTTGLAGTQDVTYYRANSAAARITPESLSEEIFDGADLFHTSGISLAISESARETTFAALKAAKQAGVPISFDINHRNRLWSNDEAIPHYRQAISQADIVFAGRAEAGLVTGLAAKTDPHELLEGLQQLTSGIVVLKEGAEGSWALENDSLVHVPALSIQAVDTVGAGDGFAAGFLDSFLQGNERNVAHCLETGNRVGAFACLNAGDWEGYPTPAQLEIFDAPEGTEVVSR